MVDGVCCSSAVNSLFRWSAQDWGGSGAGEWRCDGFQVRGSSSDGSMVLFAVTLIG